MTLPGWAREPLVHFLIGGAAIFALAFWIGEPADPAARDIAVSRAQIAELAAGWERRMRRPPTDAELDTLVEGWVRDEVLYREALRLGLDDGDAVLRQRLAQKMDAIAGARAELADPGDAVLQDWLEANPQRFLPEYRVGFDQVFFDSRIRAAAQRADLAKGVREEPEGDAIGLPATNRDTDKREVESRFGRQFTRGLEGVAADGAWHGPIPSGFGWHLVRVHERSTEMAELAPIRERVLEDWRFRTAGERREEAYRTLRQAYTVNVER